MVHAKVQLMESSFTPGDPFPTENHLKECKLGNLVYSHRCLHYWVFRIKCHTLMHQLITI